MQTPSRAEIYSLDDCAEWDVPVPQWTGAQGEVRGVRVRALTYKDRMTAAQKATDKDGKVNDWLLVAMETAAGITRPAGLTADSLLNWNADVVLLIHDRILGVGGLPGALAAQELARLAGGPPPEPGRVARGPGAHPEPVGRDPEPAPGPAAEQPVAADG